MSISIRWLLLAIIYCSSGYLSTVRGNVIGIDFASDAFKVAVVQPGTPLEIVTNLQSKRKTPMCLSFYRGERLFGADAVALMGRKPEVTFAKLYRMLGRGPEHPIVKELTERHFFPYNIYANETTGATALKLPDTHYAPEELVAMMMEHVKDLTVNFGGKAIKDCVITVPAYFTQHEKEAVYTAAAMADMKVLSLMEENTAAALHYAIDRTFSADEPPTIVMYFNMGAGAVQVSVVSYSAYPSKEMGKNKTVNHFEVIGKAWDDSLGGFNFDVRLADMLAQRFNEAWGKKKSGKGKDLRDFSAPMTKLRIQANKVKEVLSANSEFPVRAEQLHADTDLNTKVTRQELEDACRDLYDRLTLPIDKALAMANITMKQVHAVELLGGGVRMPRVKSILQEYLTAQEADSSIIGQHLNGDEAMALGAAFRAANLSTAFRVRKTGAADIMPFGVAVRLTSLDEESGAAGVLGGLFGGSIGSKSKKKPDGDAEAWSKYAQLYPVKSLIPGKTKTVAFQYDQDIVCRLEYDNSSVLLPPGTGQLIAEYNITGVAAFAKEHADKNLGAPKVHLSFSLDNAGIVTLTKAEVTYELPAADANADSGAKDAAAEAGTAAAEDASGDAEGSANSDSDADPEAEADGEASTGGNGAETDAADSTKSSSSSGKKKPSKGKGKGKESSGKKKDDNTIRQTLIFTRNSVFGSPLLGASTPTWSDAQIAEGTARLAELRAADVLRKEKEAAMNDLESFIYKVKNNIMDKEKELKPISTDEQRQEVIDMANEAEEWLYDEGRDQPVPVYKARFQEIDSKFRAIFMRLEESSARPAAVAKALGQLQNVTKLMDTWETKMPHITEEEKSKLANAVADAEAWINGKVAEQDAADPTTPPVFLSSELPSQLKPVKSLLERLLKKPKPAPPKPQMNATANANETTGADGDDAGTIRVELEEQEGHAGDSQDSSSSTEGIFDEQSEGTDAENLKEEL